MHCRSVVAPVRDSSLDYGSKEGPESARFPPDRENARMVASAA
jgi:hypothetical protein